MKTKKKGAKLFVSLALVMSVPIIILSFILMILGKEGVSKGMEMEIRKALAATARETVAIYSLSYPGEIHMSGDDFYMGETNLTNDYKLLDQIKDNTGNELSIFYGDMRALTTITNDDGERFVHTTTEDANILSNIMMGNDYYSSHVKINGKLYYGYYVPLKNQDEICGMVFAGKTNESVTSSVNTILTKIMITFVIALLVIVAIASAYAGSIVRILNQIRAYIGSLAENNFDTRMSKNVLERSDELGDMGRHAQEVGETLQALIYKDPLTGLYNRRAGRIELSNYIDAAERSNYRKQVTVALGDIDFFKKVNDTYGHDCGDIVLKTVAEVFQKHIEKNGIPIRWGGEEFLLAFKTDFDTAYGIVENMLNEIREIDFCYEEKHFHVTMTLGITPFKERDSIEQIVKRADDLLYEGKSGGRNRIVVEES